MPAQRVRAAHEVQKVCDVRIATDTADRHETLSADVFLPVGAGKVPALVTLSPYRKDAGMGIMLEQTLRWFAANGFASVLVDFRGTGSSDGMQRPPFDPGEAEDGIAAIEWAAQQPWCTGSVGMWGMSYGAVLTMRVAAKRPRHLKAIIPIMGMTDPELDFVHPQGARGCLAPLAFWGVYTLVDQLLPPISRFEAPEEQARWKERAKCAEPWLLDLWRHRPGDPVWRERAFDAAQIAAPTLCICGWRDLFCDPSIRAFEKIPAAKKLVIGPWMHTLPDQSPFAPWDYTQLALRWWDHWLNGRPNGVMSGPQAYVFVQGSQGRWRAFDSWWPEKTVVRMSGIPSADTGGELRESGGLDHADGRQRPRAARFKRDTTVGALGGLCGTATSGFGLPRDQYEDDVRCTTFTSDGMMEELVIAGRPTVIVRWSQRCAPTRIVARLTDVSPTGRSTLITLGILANPRACDSHEVVLGATCYAVPSGHRLRVTLSDADFPRLWPPTAIESNELSLSGIDVSVPMMREGAGCPVEMPEPKGRIGAAEPLAFHGRPVWKIERDLIHDGVTVVVGDGYSALSPGREHLLECEYHISSSVASSAVPAALVESQAAATAKLATGEVIRVAARAILRHDQMRVEGRVTMNDVLLFWQEWQV